MEIFLITLIILLILFLISLWIVRTSLPPSIAKDIYSNLLFKISLSLLTVIYILMSINFSLTILNH